MKMLFRTAPALLALSHACAPEPALAQTVQLPAEYAPAQASCFGTLGGPVKCVDEANGLPTSDRAFRGEVPMTVGTVYPARRSLKAICTAAGNVAVTYADASTGTWPVVVGTQTLPISVTTVLSAGTTATCTYANLI